MALALCHILPRDNIMRFCVVLLIASFILQAVAIARRQDDGSAGTFYKDGSNVVIFMNAEIDLRQGTPSVSFCSPSTKLSSEACTHFVNKMRVSVGFIVAAFISTPIAMMVISAVIVQLSSTTTKMVIGFWVCVLFPFLLTLIGTCVFFVNVASKLIDDTAYTSYDRGVSTNLVVASCALHCFTFVLASVRLCICAFVRPAIKRDLIESKNIESVMTLHMVNDDWDRQKRVWASHQEVVKEDIDREERSLSNTQNAKGDSSVVAVGGSREPIGDDMPRTAEDTNVAFSGTEPAAQ